MEPVPGGGGGGVGPPAFGKPEQEQSERAESSTSKTTGLLRVIEYPTGDAVLWDPVNSLMLNQVAL
jgi:hypothetical protein